MQNTRNSQEFEPRTFGKYYLLDRIAVGGMAEIFKAKQFGIGGFEKLLVIKKILPHLSEDKEFVEMFIDEALISVSLSHSNIIQVYELGQIENNYFIAMEYIDGKNLREIIKKCKEKEAKLSVEQILFIIMEACKGLDYAHRKKKPSSNESLQIIHRDISPQNIMSSYEGEVKIADFGIAKAKGKISKTQAGVLKGKFGYMSPEQARGLEMDHRSDIFSLGIMFWELLTDSRLFLGDSDFDTLEKVKSLKIPHPSSLVKGISSEIDEIAAKVLERDLHKRYQSASDFQVDLAKVLYGRASDFTSAKLSAFIKSLFYEEIQNSLQNTDDDGSRRLYDPEKLFLEESSKSAIEASKVENFYDYGQVTENDDGAVETKAVTGSKLPEISYFGEKTELTHVGSDSKKGKILFFGIFILLAGFAVSMYMHKDKFLHQQNNDKRDKSTQLSQSKELFGYITVETVPDTANVILDNGIAGKEQSGTSPWPVIKLAQGEHTIEISKDGFEPVKEKIIVTAGKPLEGEIQLKKYELKSLVRFGHLVIMSEPDGALIFIDNEDTGKVTPSAFDNLVEGTSHSIVLKKPSYDEFALTHTIETGQENRVYAKLNQRMGKLKITSIPSNAVIIINDKKYGKTPLEIPGIIPEKTYKIIITYNNDKDYYPDEKTVTLTDTTIPLNVYFELKSKPVEYGYAAFQGIPWAYIYIDGKSTNQQTYAEIKLRVGTYDIELQNPNFRSLKEKIVIKKNKRVKVIGNLKTGTIEVNDD